MDIVRIKLRNNLYLFSGNKSWKLGTVTERINVKGFVNPEPNYISHHSTITGALKGYLAMGLRNSTATSWKELVKDYEVLKEEIKQILKKIGDE